MPPIIATLGPSSTTHDTLAAMIRAGMTHARLNFAWSNDEERYAQIALLHAVSAELGTSLPIVADLPGPRRADPGGHSYDEHAPALTANDEAEIAFGVREEVEYFVLSFVKDAADIELCRDAVRAAQGAQKIIAKIERSAALEELDEIITAADAVMLGRGDLGREVPIEEIPFIESRVIECARKVRKPVIVATQMLESMVEADHPTRAEVSDVAWAVLQGAGVMLSEESAIGKHPVEAVAVMRRIATRAAAHRAPDFIVYPL